MSDPHELKLRDFQPGALDVFVRDAINKSLEVGDIRVVIRPPEGVSMRVVARLLQSVITLKQHDFPIRFELLEHSTALEQLWKHAVYLVGWELSDDRAGLFDFEALGLTPDEVEAQFFDALVEMSGRPSLLPETREFSDKLWRGRERFYLMSYERDNAYLDWVFDYNKGPARRPRLKNSSDLFRSCALLFSVFKNTQNPPTGATQRAFKNFCQELIENACQHGVNDVEGERIPQAVWGIYENFYQTVNLNAGTDNDKRLEGYLVGLGGRLKKDKISFVEVSVFDSGRGILSTIENRDLSEASFEDQKDAFIKAILFSSKSGVGAGMGFPNVLRAAVATRSAVCFRVGNIEAVFNGDKEAEDARDDWFRPVGTESEHESPVVIRQKFIERVRGACERNMQIRQCDARAAGTLVSVLFPVLRDPE